MNNEYVYPDTLKSMITSYTGVNTHIVKIKYQMKHHLYKYLGNKDNWFCALWILVKIKNKLSFYFNNQFKLI